MKNIFKSFAEMSITLAIILTACGGGGSSSGETSGGGSNVTPAGTFTKEVALTAFTTANTGIFGDNSFRHYHRLYKSENIAGSGYIKSIYFRRDATSSTAVTCSHLTIKMVHTSIGDLGGFGTNLNDNFGDKGSAETVLNDTTITIPGGNSGDYFEIPLTTQFNYNGADNLIIDLTRTAACSPQGVDVIVGRETSTYVANAYSQSSSTPDTVAVTDRNVLHTKFVFAGGDNKVDFLAIGYGSQMQPFDTNIGSQKVQMLYNKDSIAGSGLITGIGLQVSADTTEQTYTYTMKLGHSTKTNLDTTWTNNFDVGSPVTVANALQFRIPAGIPAGEIIWLPIPDGAFSYNGINNFVIEIAIGDDSLATGNISLATHPTTNINRIYGSPANSTATSSNSYTHQIALRFYGGQVTVLREGLEGNSSQILGSDTAGQSQKLYESYLLGTSGIITNLYIRLADTAPATASLTNYKLYMGHTVKTEFNILDTYASNMDEDALVFSGTLTIPPGLKQGDWVKISLTSPFSYNSAENLSILFTTDEGPSGNNVRAIFTDAFINHTVGRWDNSVTITGNPEFTSDSIADLALDIVK